MTALTRGPLPAGVYWRRRLAVIGIVLLFVVGVTRLFGGDGGEPRAQEAATNVAASTAPSVSGAPTPEPTAAPAPTPAPEATPVEPTPTAPLLLAPEGRCDDADVVATPTVADARATTPVVIRLELRTQSNPACTWRFGPKSLQVKITSGSDRIWSSLDCPKALGGRDLVVRRDTPTTVDVRWNSRRSDEDCSSHTDWALPGYYHATVAVLGGEPVNVQFPLRKPSEAPPAPVTPAPTATASAQPTPPAGEQRRKKRPQPGAPTATVTAPPNVD